MAEPLWPDEFEKRVTHKIADVERLLDETTASTAAEPSPEFAAAIEAAGLLQSEYPDEMAKASCTCEPEATCGAHRMLARYQQMHDHLVTVQAERRAARAEARALTARVAEQERYTDRQRERAERAEAGMRALTARLDAAHSVIRKVLAGPGQPLTPDECDAMRTATEDDDR